MPFWAFIQIYSLFFPYFSHRYSTHNFCICILLCTRLLSTSFDNQLCKLHRLFEKNVIWSYSCWGSNQWPMACESPTLTPAPPNHNCIGSLIPILLLVTHGLNRIIIIIIHSIIRIVGLNFFEHYIYI